MPLVMTSPPAAEPVTVADAKAHMRIDTDAEDVLIGSLLLTSRLHIETALSLALITQSWTLTLDRWPRGGEVDLPLAPRGTRFQLKVWEALLDIPYGETTSYGAIAAGLGHPNGSRAVGAANGRNPISIIVPCHRVIGSGGALIGYGGGLPTKRRLLDLERQEQALFSG